jgi:hypothetical protein
MPHFSALYSQNENTRKPSQNENRALHSQNENLQQKARHFMVFTYLTPRQLILKMRMLLHDSQNENPATYSQNENQAH